jgi:hypothetical protein
MRRHETNNAGRDAQTTVTRTKQVHPRLFCTTMGRKKCGGLTECVVPQWFVSLQEIGTLPAR